MSDLRTAAQQALEALEAFMHDSPRPYDAMRGQAAMGALCAALAEPVQEPVAWMMVNKTHNLGPSLHWKPQTDWHITWESVPLYTHPPRRKTEQEPVALEKLLHQVTYGDFNADNTDDLKLALAARKEFAALQPRRLTDDQIGQIWFAARIPGLTESDARRLIRAAEEAR